MAREIKIPRHSPSKRHKPGTPSHKERDILRKIPNLAELKGILAGVPDGRRGKTFAYWYPYLNAYVKLEVIAIAHKAGIHAGDTNESTGTELAAVV